MPEVSNNFYRITRIKSRESMPLKSHFNRLFKCNLAGGVGGSLK